LLLGTSSEVGFEGASAEWELKPATVSAVVAFASPTDLLRVVTDNPRELDERPVLRLEQE